MAFPLIAVGLSAVCDCGISRSYSHSFWSRFYEDKQSDKVSGGLDQKIPFAIYIFFVLKLT